MKAAVPWLLTAFGAFVAFILFLNLREKDYYEGGSLTPVAGDPAADPVFHSLIPSEFRHACPTCGDCAHPVEVLENRRTLSILDHDGWYKLFWAADETYYFEELQQLAACWENRTAEEVKGTWTIVLRAGPALHAATPAHSCTRMPVDTVRHYVLAAQNTPFEPQDRVQPAIVYRYDGDKFGPFVHFGWRLAGNEVSGVSCPCGKP
jgi:hypothetical protein